MSEEGKPEKKKKSRGRNLLYDIDYSKRTVRFKNRMCPRCGKAMANHANVARYSCGGCGYTEYIRKQQ